ncbi:response regulator transcription factor [Paenibacillus polymyxa]|uniref:response regulator transcription factor n=1 Tax=Paenibacillus polymyxa TaxID=1406 RepID=UPI0025B6B383|nr:response regulator transcription factor [Paenibacillus polymyxa]MDN4083080.1 response regulator transcription factor [Paenibacillus polymyxa]MDN4087763.1 response regulator transcription factor [Paenibacillus polymyxa]MDN4107217.1 response regulator transcription factor [Paenibacillus polymyxa]
MSPLIVLVDENEAAVFVRPLEQAGYQVVHVRNTSDVRSYIAQHPVSLLLLNIKDEQAGTQGLIRILQQNHPHVPILAMISSDEEAHMVSCFEQGAHDVMVVPFYPRVLQARVANLLRIFGVERDAKRAIEAGDIHIDTASRTVSRGERKLELTPKEFDLLLHLAMHLNQVCSRQQILKDVWKHDYIADTNVVDVYIRHLRVKVDRGQKFKMIRTERGIGYSLRTPTEAK